MSKSDNDISYGNLTESVPHPDDPSVAPENLNMNLDANSMLGTKKQEKTASGKNERKYAVGYGKPPKSTRFKPGQSGNPKGRPPESRSFKEDVEAIMRSKIPVIEDGKSRKITKSRAIAAQHVHKAMQGHLGSAKFVVQSIQSDSSEQQDNLPSLLEKFQDRYRKLSDLSSGNEILIDSDAGRSTDETGGNS
jgi:Family of unknown function (DUF5681)